MNYRHINSTPDTTNNAQLPFPGFATTGSQQSTRWTTSESLRSTFTNNLVNEFRVGGTGGATLFSPELSADMWGGSGTGSQGSLRLNINGACCGAGFALTNPGLAATPSSREAGTKVMEDTATWLKGKHSVTFGGSFVQADVWLQNQTLVPTVTFGVVGQRSGHGHVHRDELPGRLDDRSDAGAEPVRDAHRPCDAGGRRRAHHAGRRLVRAARPVEGPRAHA